MHDGLAQRPVVELYVVVTDAVPALQVAVAEDVVGLLHLPLVSGA